MPEPDRPDPAAERPPSEGGLDGGRPGRRAQHKQRTRDAINAAAMQLFFAHGFDAVTVAQVAGAAGVSVATVFNYFDTKEDLFFDEVEPLADALAQAVRDCPPGASILLALRGQLNNQLTGGRTEPGYLEVARFHDAIEHSVALQRREQEIQLYRRKVLGSAIAEAIAEEPPSALAQLAAAQYLTVEHIVAGELRGRLSDGSSTAAALAELAPLADRLFAAVRDGFGPLPKVQPGPPPDARSGPPLNARSGPSPDARSGLSPDARSRPPLNARSGPPLNARSGPSPDARSGLSPDARSGPPPGAQPGPSTTPSRRH